MKKAYYSLFIVIGLFPSCLLSIFDDCANVDCEAIIQSVTIKIQDISGRDLLGQNGLYSEDQLKTFYFAYDTVKAPMENYVDSGLITIDVYLQQPEFVVQVADSIQFVFKLTSEIIKNPNDECCKIGYITSLEQGDKIYCQSKEACGDTEIVLIIE